MPRPVITCIYCKQAKLPSKEHALQKSLGGNLTTPFVCAECNNGFASIDQALAAYSGRCRSPFRADGDHDSGMMPIRIPG
jgi:hypothetical protein